MSRKKKKPTKQKIINTLNSKTSKGAEFAVLKLEPQKQEELREELIRYYNQKQSQAFYDFLYSMVEKNSLADTLIDGRSLSERIAEVEKIYDMQQLIFSILLRPSLIRAIVEKMDPKVYAIHQYLTWISPLTVREIKQKYSLDPLSTDLNKYNQVVVYVHFSMAWVQMQERGFYSLKINDERLENCYFFIPPMMRQIFKEVFDKPESSKIAPLAAMPACEFMLLNDLAIPEKIVDLLELMQGDSLVDAKGGQYSLSGMRKLSNTLEIEEFFLDGNSSRLKLLRMRMLLTCLEGIISNKKTSLLLKGNISETYMSIYENLEAMSISFFTENFWKHIKDFGRTYPYDYHPDYTARLVAALKQSLLKMPPDVWLDYHNISHYIFANNTFKILLNDFDYRSFQFQGTESGSTSNDRRSIFIEKHLDYEKLRPLVYEPMIKGLLFLFAAFGFIDIAYDTPFNDHYQLTSQSWLTTFDSLRAIRINPAGLYVQKKETSLLIADTATTYTLSADPLYLVINVEGNYKKASIVLLKYAQQISANKYRLDYETFLSDCNNLIDLNKKIDQLKKILGDELPPIWQNFFNKLRGKIVQLEEKIDYRLFRIGDNPALAKLLVTDADIRQLVIRAEDFHFLVRERNVNMLVKKLRASGFIVNI